MPSLPGPATSAANVAGTKPPLYDCRPFQMTIRSPDLGAPAGLRADPRAWFASLALAGLLGGAYLATLLPGTGHSGDTAEFQFSGRLLCVTHPTGYPTYLLLSHLFSRLVPFASLAYRANLLSAVFAVLACIALRRLLLLLGARPIVAFSTAFAYGFTPTFWRHAVVAEVYTLHVLFLAVVLERFLQWHRTKRRRDLLVACAVYALSFGNHLTMVTLLPAILWIVAVTRWRTLLEPRSVLPVLGLIAAGASQYAYPLWRALDPATPYLAAEPVDLSGLWSYATGASFHGAMFAFTPWQLLVERVPLLLAYSWSELGILSAVALAGLLCLREKVAAVFVGLAFLGHAVFVLSYDVPDLFAFFIPTYFVTVLWLGVGLERLVGLAGARRRWALLCLGLPLALCLRSWGRVQEEKGPRAAEPMHALLAEVRGGAFIVAGYHEYQFLLYDILAEKRGGPAVFVGHQVTPEDFEAYLLRDRPVYLRPLRRWVPPGLPVYSTKLNLKRSYREAGFSVSPTRWGAYRIGAAPPQSSSQAKSDPRPSR